MSWPVVCLDVPPRQFKPQVSLTHWFSLFVVLLSSFLWKCLLLFSPNTLHFPSFTLEPMNRSHLVACLVLGEKNEPVRYSTLQIRLLTVMGLWVRDRIVKQWRGWRQTGLWAGSYTEATTLGCCERTTGNRENNKSSCGLLTVPLCDASCCVSEAENVARQHLGGRHPAEAVLDHSRTAL